MRLWAGGNWGQGAVESKRQRLQLTRLRHECRVVSCQGAAEEVGEKAGWQRREQVPPEGGPMVALQPELGEFRMKEGEGSFLGPWIRSRGGGRNRTAARMGGRFR
jgi:hypothetical protein